MSTLLIKNADALITMDDQQRQFRGGGVFIRDNVIEQIGPSAELPATADQVIDAKGMAILPGLINTHHHFYQTLTRAVPGSQNEELFDWLVRLLPSPNLFYALRIEGDFAAVKARSVPKQENYRTLVEVAREQALFQYENVSGTLVGFFTPSFMASLSVPGLHLHFLSADFRSGGHLLECRPRKIRAGVQFINRLELDLPLSLDYLTWDFRRDTRKDLHQAEN